MNRRLAQMDPMAMGGAPLMDPMAMGGTPPMDPMGGMGMGGPPVMPMAAPGAPAASREEIGSPLDSLGKILYDVDITTLLLSRIGDSADDTALYVWLMYGGDEHGGAIKDRIGKRTKKKNVTKEQEEAEQDRTEDSRWERLTSGKKITEISSLDEMTEEVKGIAASAVKNEIKAQGAPAGGGMPMAVRHNNMVKIARKLDKIGFYRSADTIRFK
jgi:hypothetical protein